MSDLDRFKRAQDDRHAGFSVALHELQAGRKTSHWIWYVFPQLSGLGRSPMAARYGLADPDEAAAYLRDPVLLQRLVSATSAVVAHVAPARARPASLEQLMGSDVDVLKLVSSMTLFRDVASKLQADAPSSELSTLVAHAAAILTTAADQGYEPCAFTLAQLGAPPAFREPPEGPR